MTRSAAGGVRSGSRWLVLFLESIFEMSFRDSLRWMHCYPGNPFPRFPPWPYSNPTQRPLTHSISNSYLRPSFCCSFTYWIPWDLSSSQLAVNPYSFCYFSGKLVLIGYCCSDFSATTTEDCLQPQGTSEVYDFLRPCHPEFFFASWSHLFQTSCPIFIYNYPQKLAFLWSLFVSLISLSCFWGSTLVASLGASELDPSNSEDWYHFSALLHICSYPSTRSASPSQASHYSSNYYLYALMAWRHPQLS